MSRINLERIFQAAANSNFNGDNNSFNTGWVAGITDNLQSDTNRDRCSNEPEERTNNYCLSSRRNTEFLRAAFNMQTARGNITNALFIELGPQVRSVSAILNNRYVVQDNNLDGVINAGDSIRDLQSDSTIIFSLGTAIRGTNRAQLNRTYESLLAEAARHVFIEEPSADPLDQRTALRPPLGIVCQSGQPLPANWRRENLQIDGQNFDIIVAASSIRGNTVEGTMHDCLGDNFVALPIAHFASLAIPRSAYLLLCDGNTHHIQINTRNVSLDLRQSPRLSCPPIPEIPPRNLP